MTEQITSPLFFMRETSDENLTQILSKRLREVKKLNRQLDAEKERSEKLNKKFQAAIRKLVITEKKFRSLYDGSPDMYRTINTDGVILDCNEEYYKKLGYSSKKEVLGKSILDFVTKSSLPSLKKSFENWKKTGLSRNHKVWMKRKDGKVFPALVSASSLYDLNGILIGSNTVIRDISEIFEERKKATEEKTKRLAAIGELAARLAHDLRNPLSVVKNTLELLRLEAKDDQDENTTKRFARIDRAVTRMSNQIENVLDFVKAKPLDLNKESFSKVLSSVIDRINIPSKVRIHLPQNDVKIICDFEQLEIVLINLMTNAIQAMNNTGEIYIRASDEVSHILIEIEDSGPGINSKSLPKIFDPLFTTRQIGTGLGLPSCKTIVEKHHGTIDVDTILGKGTTFKITLPKI